MLDYDKALKGPMSLSCLNAMNSNISLNALNANLTLNASNASVVKCTTVDSKVQTCANSAITVRSRYAKFICDKNPQIELVFIGSYEDINCLRCRRQREREPSRIPAKKICRLLTKSRKLRKAF